MAQKKKLSPKKEGRDLPKMKLNPETKKGIYVICIFAVSALIFLSFFHIAGSVGIWINKGLTAFFGLDRYIVPFILIIIGATLAYPERGKLSIWNYLGLFFFFLSFNALLNLFLVNEPQPFTQDISLAGGYLGLLGTSPQFRHHDRRQDPDDHHHQQQLNEGKTLWHIYSV